ncbi:hypothetical protein [Bacillus massiliglaciei]|uniref:hypothetical protein n=1 Tax=Bacillus massiliglaciei TaxID=1816693 RepID=UPI000DA619D2|nr:hypothetical protein [Bacillus massiliglaciei]
MDLFTFNTLTDPTLNLRVEKEFPGLRCVGGKYTAENHTITLYERDIAIQCERKLGSLERVEEYAWIIYAHELGHAMDPLLSEMSEEFFRTSDSGILYQIESNAWEIAKGYIPFIDQDLFALIREESLRHCTARVEAV